MAELITIGAFARLARLSPKALRLYDELGLLVPAAVDSDSRYRHYRPAQLDRARLIAGLRELDLPLARIGELLDLPAPQAAAAAAVETYRTELLARTADRDRRAALLVDQLTGKGNTDMTTQLRYAGRTAIGLVRPTNEDAVYVGPGVIAVADGVGGPAGAAAATAAVGALHDWDGPVDVLAPLATVVRAAEQAVRAVAAEGEAVTTLTALLWSGEDRLAVIHVGDARAYRLRRGTLTRLTHDHTYVQSLVDDGELTAEQAAAHPQRALLVRALTGGDDDRLDVATHDTRAGDRYLVATDGLTAVVAEDDLTALLAAADGPESAVEALIAAAYRGGAPDNVSCAVADVVTP